jgi:hypothetical protein
MKLGRIIKKILEKLVRLIQKILLTVFLSLIYFLGFAATVFFVVLFNRKLIYGSLKAKNSSWREAEGYDLSLQESLRQS